MTVSDRLDPEHIHDSWLISKTALAVYRSAALIFVLYTVLYTLAFSSIPRYLLFATHWNTLLILSFFIMATISDWKWIQNRKLTIATLIVFESSVPIAFIIVALYWGAINPSRGFESVNLALSSVQNHGIVSALIYFDLFLNSVVVHAGHVIYPLALTILYLLLNAIWTLTTRQPIYPYIDWRSFWTLYIVLIGLALVVIVHFTVWFVTVVLRPGSDQRTTEAGELDESKPGEQV